MSSICSDPSQRGIQFGEAFGYSLANMFGFGSILEQAVPTPLDKLQSAIQKKQSETQNIINQSSLAFAQQQDKVDADIFGAIKSMQSVLEEEASFHDEILREKIILISNIF